MSAFTEFVTRYETIIAEGEAAGFLRWNEDGATEIINPADAAREVEERARWKDELRQRERQGIADVWNDFSLATKPQGGNRK